MASDTHCQGKGVSMQLSICEQRIPSASITKSN